MARWGEANSIIDLLICFHRILLVKAKIEEKNIIEERNHVKKAQRYRVGNVICSGSFNITNTWLQYDVLFIFG